MVELTRFWFEFNVPGAGRYGVTAYNYDDAINLLKAAVFRDSEIPEIKTVIENIDVSTLDEGKILPNIGTPSFRGIWYPALMNS